MTTKLKGSHPWLVILCHPSDRSEPSQPAPDYFTSFISEAGAGGLYDFWSQISGGRLDLAGSRVLGWYRLRQSLAEIPTGPRVRSAAAAIARAAATAAREDLSGYRYTIALIAYWEEFGNQGTDVVSYIAEWPGQPGWRWCSQCECLAYWDGTRSPGPCAGGPTHEHSGSSWYSVEDETVTVVGGELGWRWCRRCEAMVFATFPPPACPAGPGGHELGMDTAYVIRAGRTGPGEQNNWKRCRACQCLAYDNPGRGPGRCLVNGRHDHGSANYSLPLAWSASVGAFGHETGHAFGLDHAFGPSRLGQFRNDTQPGAYDDRTDLMGIGAQFATPRFTPGGSGLSAPTLHKLGWVEDRRVTRIYGGAGTQTVTLSPLYGSATGTRMVQVIRAPENRIYTASYRPPTGWDRGLGNRRVVVHAQRGLYSAGQDCWAWCGNCQGMIYGGTMLCPAGGLHDGGGSQDYGLLFNVGPGGGQNNWRWCHKCEGLFFAGNRTNGRCPAGDAHDLRGSADYLLPTSGDGQAGWKWCHKCEGLSYDGQAMKGNCPAGGFHDHTGSSDYVLATGGGPNLQNKWRRCGKCQGLFYAGQGACAGGVHQLSGDDYALARDLDDAFGQPGWKFCSKCRGLAFHDGTRQPGICPAGERHDHSGSGRYTLPTDAEARSAQQGWFFCTLCSGLNFFDGTRGAGRCAGGPAHTRDGEFEIARNTTAVPGEMRFRWCRMCECMVLGDNPAGCVTGAAHDTSASSTYVVRTNTSTLTGEESFWRVCSSCNILMRLNSPNGMAEMPCPVSLRHTPTGEYFLTMRTHKKKWRWCRRCEMLILFDGTQPPGRCLVRGPLPLQHDFGGSDFYFPPRRREEAVQLAALNLQEGESYTADIGGTTFEVVSLSATAATVRVTT